MCLLSLSSFAHFYISLHSIFFCSSIFEVERFFYWSWKSYMIKIKNKIHCLFFSENNKVKGVCVHWTWSISSVKQNNDPFVMQLAARGNRCLSTYLFFCVCNTWIASSFFFLSELAKFFFLWQEPLIFQRFVYLFFFRRANNKKKKKERQLEGSWNISPSDNKHLVVLSRNIVSAKFSKRGSK